MVRRPENSCTFDLSKWFSFSKVNRGSNDRLQSVRVKNGLVKMCIALRNQAGRFQIDMFYTFIRYYLGRYRFWCFGLYCFKRLLPQFSLLVILQCHSNIPIPFRRASNLMFNESVNLGKRELAIRVKKSSCTNDVSSSSYDDWYNVRIILED